MMKLLNLTLKSLLYLSITYASENNGEGTEHDRNLRMRVIGGTGASPTDYPWFAHIGGSRCGGSLVSPEFILSAAHCLDSNIYQKAIIGKYCKNSDNCGYYKEMIPVTDVYVHPDWDKSSNDMMLLKLEKRSIIEPVEMDFGSVSDNYIKGQGGLWTAGFGNTAVKSSTQPYRIQHLELKYVTNEECNLDYQNDDKWNVDETEICAIEINEDRSKQACFGDSGGPLYDKNANKLVGVTSWGDKDCTSKIVVYSRIANQVSVLSVWILLIFCFFLTDILNQIIDRVDHKHNM